MLKRPHYIAFGVVLAAVLTFFSLPKKTAAQLKLAVSGVFLPLVGLVQSAEHFSGYLKQSIASRRSMVKELEALRQENQKLRLSAAQAQQVWQENSQLRQAVQWQKISPWKLKLARVLLRDPANWWRSLQIDLGQRDGLRANMPVLTADGLVGCVREAGENRSEVALIGDPKCQVSALVQESNAHGILAAGPSSILEQAIVNLTYLPRQSRIKPGDEIITSGFGGIYPKGIPVGRVVDTNSVSYGLYLEARVKLLADLNHLDEVWVLFP